jgi:hypothetical protein
MASKDCGAVVYEHSKHKRSGGLEERHFVSMINRRVLESGGSGPM